MRIFLLIVIRIYWFLIPKSKRRKCIFRKSCSNYVFEETLKNGLWVGLKAFRFRYENCRHGFEVFKNPIDNKVQMILTNHQIIGEENIAERLIKKDINMKKVVIVILFLTIHLAIGQKIENISNAELFSSQAGTLIEKEFIDIGNVGKTKIQILKITDMISGKSIRSLRIEHKIKAGYSTETKIASLDSDEIEGLIKSINIIKENIFGSIANNYTEITFQSRSGFKAGCFWNIKNEWTIYLQIKKNDRESMVFLKKEKFNDFLNLLELAKNKV